MRRRDKHSALKTEVIGSASGRSVQFTLVKQMWGKNDIAYSLHAAPHSYSTAGLQTTDFLSYLGFERNRCAFVTTKECYSHWVEHNFNLKEFGEAFAEAFNKIEKAERHLNACGFLLAQPEGWGYFFGKPAENKKRRPFSSSYGDGHIAPKSELMKEIEGETFQFVLSWITGDRDKGWTFHYRPKHLPLLDEFQVLFGFLELKTYEECPYFKFEKCYWRFIPHESRGDSFFESNAGSVHGWFDAHSNRFEVGLKELLAAQTVVQPFNMFFLPLKDNIQILPHSPSDTITSNLFTETSISSTPTVKIDDRLAVRPTVFVCYSHKDEKEKNELLSHLGVLEAANLIELWSDDRIRAGADLEAEINQVIDRASVAILLITANFLTSEFIQKKEIPELLERHNKEDIIIFPVIAKSCVWKEVRWLERMNVRPRGEKPVWRESGRYVDEELTDIAAEIANMMKNKT